MPNWKKVIIKDSAAELASLDTSGNISSSGTVVGSNLSGNNTGDSTITDSVTTTSSTIRASATAVKTAKDAAYANTILIGNQQSLNTIQSNAIVSNDADIATNVADIATNVADIATKANIASPALTGVPEAPTATANTNTTQIATTAYTDAAIAALVDTAPGNLNTLNELAAALGDDVNFSTTVTNSIAAKLPKAGGTMSGPIAMGNQNITGGGSITGTSLAATTVEFTNLYGNGSNIDIGLGKFGALAIDDFFGRQQLLMVNNSALFGDKTDYPFVIGKRGAGATLPGGDLLIHSGDTLAGSTNNLAGGHLNIRGGYGKGTGPGGEIRFGVSPSTTSGNSLNTSYTALTIRQDRSAVFDKSVSAEAVISPTLTTDTAQSRSKLMVWSGTTYAIGMKTGYTFGGLNNDYAMSFQMNDDADRGFWWGHDSHTDAQGAMALTTDGRLSVAQFLRLGYGETDTTIPDTHSLDVNGDIFLTGDVIGQTTKERWIKNVAYVVVAGSTEQFIPLVGAAENPNEANGSSAMVMPTGGKLLKVHIRTNRNLHQLSGTSTANNITVKMHKWSPGTVHSQTTETTLGAVTGVGPTITAVGVYDFTGTLDTIVGGTPTNVFAAGDLLGFGIKHSQNMAENTKYFVTLVFEMDWESY